MLSARKNDARSSGTDAAWHSAKPMRQSRAASLGIIAAIIIAFMLVSLKFAKELLTQPVALPLSIPIEIEQEIFIKPKKMEKILAEESQHIIYEPPPPPPEVKPKPKPEPPPPPPPKPKPKPKVVPKVKPKPTPAVAAPAPVDNSAALAAQKVQDEKMALGILVGLIEQNKKYPRQAMKRGIQGAIRLHVVVNAQGVITAATVVGGGPSILKKATEDLGKKLIGKNVGVKTSLNVRVPIAYTMK